MAGEFLDLLAQGPRYVDAQAAEMEMSVANISQHLQILRNAKRSSRAGRQPRPVLPDQRYRPHALLDLRTVAEEHLPEIRQLRDQHSVEGLDEEPLAKQAGMR